MTRQGLKPIHFFFLIPTLKGGVIGAKAPGEEHLRAKYSRIRGNTNYKSIDSKLYCLSPKIYQYLPKLYLMSDPINSSKAPEPVGLYPHAKRVGEFLFLSGVGPRERGTKKIPGVELNDAGKIISYDIEKQCRSVFQNVRWILEDAGSSWNKIIDVTVFLTNMKDDFPIYNKLWAEYFSDNPPCRTTIEINCLPTPIAIELKVIATI
jgi:2-aminomuconate deaminase